MMKKVTELNTHGKRYIIAKDDNGYWGISEDYLDEDGHLTQRLNGIQGLLSDTLSSCLTTCMYDAWLQELRNQGMPLEEALQTIYGELA